MLPFTTEQFLDVFQQYNGAVWPAHVLLIGIALTAVVLAVVQQRFTDAAVSTIVAGFWLWTGLTYHILFFSAINSAAIAFGIVFIVQGVLFLYAGPVRRQLSFGVGRNWPTVLGSIMLLYALLVYPLIGLALGEEYPRLPTFGVPCPTAIFTFGLLLWTDQRVPKYLLLVPVLWAVIGTSAAFLLGIWQDLGLFAAGLAGVIGVLRKDSRRSI